MNCNYSITKEEMHGSSISDFADGFVEGLQAATPDTEIGNVKPLTVNGKNALQRAVKTTMYCYSGHWKATLKTLKVKCLKY